MPATEATDTVRRALCVRAPQVDAEGMDGPILTGASTLLSRQRVGAVFLESNPAQRLASWSLLSSVRLLKSHGYVPFLFGTRRLLPLANLCAGHEVFSVERTLNVVAWPKALAATLVQTSADGYAVVVAHGARNHSELFSARKSRGSPNLDRRKKLG